MAVSRKRVWKAVIVSLVVVVVLVVAGVVVWHVVESRARERAESEHFLVMWGKVNYAQELFMDSSVYLNSLSADDARDVYTDVVYVPAEPVADSYPGDVIVCWPSAKTVDIVDGLNKTFAYNGLSLDKYGFPVGHADVLSMGDVLDDPEDVQKIFEDHTTLLKDGATLDDAIARIQRTGR